jgi:hypothetical protein
MPGPPHSPWLDLMLLEAVSNPDLPEFLVSQQFVLQIPCSFTVPWSVFSFIPFSLQIPTFHFPVTLVSSDI